MVAQQITVQIPSTLSRAAHGYNSSVRGMEARRFESSLVNHCSQNGNFQVYGETDYVSKVR